MFNLSMFAAPPPVKNDVCIDALPLSIGSTQLINFTDASSDIIPAGCVYSGEFLAPGGVWYTVMGTGKRLIARLVRSCNSTSGSFISIFDGDGCGVDELVCVAQTTSKICIPEPFYFDTTKGTMYHVLIQLYDQFMIADEMVEFTIFADTSPCGLFGWSIFCPFTFRGIIGRLIRRLFGF